MTNTFPSAQDAVSAAQDALASGDRTRAAEIYRTIAREFGAKRQAIILAAKGLRLCDLLSEAIDLLEDELKRNPVSPAVLFALSDFYVELKEYDRAASYIRRHLDRDPSQPGAWKALGDCHAFKGEWAAAEKAFAQAVALDPRYVDALVGRGDVLFNLRRNEEGIASYREADEIAPGRADILFKLGSGLMQAQMLEEAEAVLRRSIALDPIKAAPHVNLAIVLSQGGRARDAEQAARTAVAIDPKMGLAHATLGTIVLEQGRFAEAERILTRAFELAPNSVLMLTALATAQAGLGLLFDATHTWQHVLHLEPGNLEARHMLAALTAEPVRSVPDGFCEQLFDWFAPRFDRLLVGPQQYRGPEATLALLRDVEPNRDAFRSFLDVGCGTGVIGEAVGNVYRMDREVGIDVSSRMIEVARTKGVYDELIHGDANDYLASNPGAFDLIAAIDLFIYVGDLTKMMPLLAAGLSPGGLLLYTIESLDGGNYKLMPTGRFAHTPAYVESLARQAGLTPVAAKPVALRLEKGVPVAGIVGALRRPPG